MKKLMLFFVLLFLLVLSACENPLFVEASGLYTVSFETNGGTEIQAFRTNKISSSPKTQKEGEDFAGWYTSSRFVEEVSFPFELSKNITLYAKWEEHIEPYSVFFDSNGGTEVETFYGSVILETPASSKKGYRLEGWYLDKDLQNPVSFPDSPQRNCILYAKWTERSDITYLVKHYKQEIDLCNYKLYTSEEKTGTLGTITQAKAKSYTGFHNNEFQQKTINADGNTEIEIYYDRDSIAVVFDANNGSGKTDSQTFYYGVTQKLKVNKFTRKNYLFDGWSENKSGTGTKHADGSSMTLSYSQGTIITLYANWICGISVTNSTISTLSLSSLTDDCIIKVTGTINQNSLVSLASKIENANIGITLDLSEATGITTINGIGSTWESIFSECKKLEKLILPNTLKTIGSDAFKYSSFISVVIPDSVTSIGANAFLGCSCMTEVKIGNSVQSIGEWAFGLCDRLSSVVLPKSLINIAPCAFYDLKDLLSVTFADSYSKWTCRHQSLADCGYVYSVSVSNSGTNAVNLKNKYFNYFWIKN